MTNKIKSFSILQEDGNFQLLELKKNHERTLICWLNTDDNIVSIALFHKNEKPNALSHRVLLTKWGYPTYFISNMTTTEAANIVTLYLKDIQDENFWWETDKI